MTTSPPVPGTLDRGFQRQVVDFVLDWVIFPAVLYAQFDSAMHSQANEGTLNLDGTAVCIAVFLFSFAAGIYRQVLRSHPKKSLAFLLLPEIFITILLIMVVFGSIDDAYESLVAFTSVISAVGGLFAAGQTILMLGRKEESADYQLLEEVQDSEEDECMS
jgi:FlaA1/EpsC-like NDP-sugar epimerase